MKNKIFFLDAYALIFRAYYAFIKNPRINSKGFNTSAIFGFVNTLEEILKKEKPSHIGVAFDPPGKNFRHELYTEYKAHRQETPEDIKASVPFIKQIIQAYNIPVVEVAGYEADDVIGTLAKRFDNAENQVYMMTPDKDYAQLVGENVFMYKPARANGLAEIIGVNEVREKFGVDSPIKVIDILALWGDVSDNVPGVPGIGEKTAKKLIDKFGSIDNIYANINKLVGKQKIAVEENKEQLYLSQKLVTIDINVPIDISLDDFKLNAPNLDKLNEIFSDLEFNALKNRVLGQNSSLDNGVNISLSSSKSKPVDSAQLSLFESASTTDVEPVHNDGKTRFNKDEVSYHFVETLFEIDELIKALEAVNEICIDTETTSLDTSKAEIIGLAVCYKEKEAYYISMPKDFDRTKEILQMFSGVFSDSEKLIIGQNLKYDLSVLCNYDISVKSNLFDTMVAHYLLQPEQRHGLSFLSYVFLDYKMIPIEDLIGEKGRNQKNMADIDPRLVSDYACEDADITFRLKLLFEEKIKNENLLELFYDIEMPLINVLIDMERTGVKIDSETIKKYSLKLKEELRAIEEKIYTAAGESFNIASPRQLGVILFDKLKIISNPKKTKTKQYSTGEEELVKLKDKHPIINEILEYRSLNKLINTYVDVLPDMVDAKTSRLHTTYNQTIVATGRLSSNNPNLQNIPIRDERGREIRRSFIAGDSNHSFLSADYSQIELRIMAHVSKDKNMLEAFNKYSLDIHTATASKIYKVAEEQVTREMRTKAKTANFGIIYGISSFGLAQRLNIPVSEAKQLIDSYFEAFEGVKEYMQKSVNVARENGYVETIFGRKRFLPDINSKNSIVRGYAERNAINAPIQGSAADIIKIAMINIYKCFEEEGLKSKMIMQVHDELNFDVSNDELSRVQQIVVDQMQGVVKLSVPLIVEANIGRNWLEAH